jgi:thiamine biosynthesis lipoprotein
MGTVVSVNLRGPSARTAAAETPLAAFFTELSRVEDLFSPFRPESQVSRLRRGALTLADADPMLREVAELCERAEARTAGWFHPWRPDADGRPRLDPTGLVKGWAVERAARLLPQREHDFIVNAGGDLVLRCDRTDTPDWRVGLADPLRPDHIGVSFGLRVGAVATSGRYARGEHIWRPGGAPTEIARPDVHPPGQDEPPPGRHLAAASVIGPDLTWADVLATAALAADRTESDWVADFSGYQLILTDMTGRTRTIPDAQIVPATTPEAALTEA